MPIPLATVGQFVGPALSAIGGAVGAGESRRSAQAAADRNEAIAREFAKMGIRWRVADAKAAGLHPLAALGASTASGPVVALGGEAPIGQTLSNMGQDISRAVTATRSTSDRLMDKLAVERAGLENELLRSRIARENSAQVGPGMPVQVVPSKVTASHPDAPYAEGGRHPEVAFADAGGGFLTPYPSQKFQDYLSENFLAGLSFQIRNNLFGAAKPSRYDLPGDKDESQFWPVLGWKPYNKKKQAAQVKRMWEMYRGGY